MTEIYGTTSLMPDAIKYRDDEYQLCCDLKAVALLRGFKMGSQNSTAFGAYWRTMTPRNPEQSRNDL